VGRGRERGGARCRRRDRRHARGRAARAAVRPPVDRRRRCRVLRLALRRHAAGLVELGATSR
jgi:hypothetical protein